MMKRSKAIELLDKLIIKLFNEEKLEVKYKDHQLMGIYRDSRECHVEPDWLLIYRIENDELILERTGSHSDLFE